MPRNNLPVTPAPFPGDTTPDLQHILREVREGCSGHHERKIVAARELVDYFEGDSEKYVAFKPAEDALSWLTRPKRVSFLVRQAISKLTDHLYKPGPRQRSISTDKDVDAWYAQVVRDVHLDAVLHRCDQLAHLHGIVAIGVYSTGNPKRPINYHLYPRQDFTYWASPDDPRVAVAVCTITKVRHELVRYRLWTRTHYYTFFKGKQWGYTPGGWGVARFDPGSSGPHAYGTLPFAFVTYQVPTTELETPGIGHLLAKVNRAANIDKSNLALWVHHYARPLGFVSGVGPEWRPRFVDGGFVPLVARSSSTEDAPIVPEARYLESNIDIGAIQSYIMGEVNQALDEIGVPVSIQATGGGFKIQADKASGIAIAAADADLITYAKGRQPIAAMCETALASLICRVGASPGANADAALAHKLERVAIDPALRLAWNEPQIDLPGQDRDNSDQFELTVGITDPIELLIRRQGLTEAEAVSQYTSVRRRIALAQRIDTEQQQLVEAARTVDSLVPPDDRPTAGADVEDVEDQGSGDMGVKDGEGPSNMIQPAQQIQPRISVTTAVDPQYPIPAGPLILPATPGFGGFGTES